MATLRLVRPVSQWYNDGRSGPAGFSTSPQSFPYSGRRGAIGDARSLVGVQYRPPSSSTRFLQPGEVRAADLAFERAHREIGYRLQRVAFQALSNRLVKSRAAGRAKYNWSKDTRGGRGIRAALRDPDFSQPMKPSWAHGVIVGNEAVFARYGAQDYWRTIEGGGGPVGRWFPNSVFGMDGLLVAGPRTTETAKSREAFQRRANQALSDTPRSKRAQRKRILSVYQSGIAADDATRGRALSNWRGMAGATFAEGVLAKNGLSGSKRGSVRANGDDGERRGFFQVRKPIVPVRYIAEMELKARQWRNDGTFAGIYQAELRKAGIIVRDRSLLRARSGAR